MSFRPLSLSLISEFSSVLFQFLNLSSHFSLASTSKAFMKTSRVSMSWDKRTVLPKGITTEQLKHFCNVASPSELRVPQGNKRGYFCIVRPSCEVVDGPFVQRYLWCRIESFFAARELGSHELR